MSIRCPYCQHAMTLAGPKPGRYTPKCKKCEKRFVLLVPDPTPVALTFEAEEAQKQSTPQPAQDVAAQDVAATLPPAGISETAHPAATLPSNGVTETAPAADTLAASPEGTTPKTAPTTEIAATLAPSAGVAETLPPVAGSAGVAATAPFDPQATAAPADPEATGDFSLAPAPATRFAGDLATLAPAGSAAEGEIGETPKQLGGYRILKELGRGAMGAVYLAKQISLDRNVALKVIQSRWSDDPVFISRFTREAYAAAQLTHHNIVQVYDLGADRDVNFFSMEFVAGESLSALLKKQGKLDVETAVGYVLQAARGLQFAHDHGMVHRDIKPDNLMLNEQGVVKVADLGLVKTAGSAADDKAAPAVQSDVARLASSTETVANRAMGTPAYMPPEQAENAAGVDHRADIYSLGCTLYVLLTGRLPFEGATAMEVITKHKTEPIVRPDAIVKRVPAGLAEINLKMVAKRPEDRYQSLTEVIAALEGFLGIQAKGEFSPAEEHADRLEQCIGEFNAPLLAKLRPFLGLGLAAACWLVSLISLPFSWMFAAGCFFLPLLTLAAYFVVGGINDRTHLFAKARELAFNGKISDWLLVAAGLALFLLALWLIGGIFGVVLLAVFCALAVGLAAGYYFGIDRQISAARVKPLREIDDLLRMLRARGVGETSLRQFLVKYGGNQWEEFYEALFGFEEKIAAREFLGRGELDRRRRKFRAWREPLVNWIDERLKAQKAARERKHLARIEEKGLAAQGLDQMQARRKAREAAEALVEGAAELRAAAAHPTPAATPAAAAEKRARIKAMLAAARIEGKRQKGSSPLALALAPWQFALGAKVRFLLGAALLAGCALWVHQNRLLSVSDVTEAATRALETQSLEGAAPAKLTLPASGTRPLSLPLVPEFLLAWFNSLNPGVAGLALVVSSLLRGVKISFFMFPAAAVLLFGHVLGLPGIGSWAPAETTSLFLGLALAALGFVFGRTRAES